MSKDTILVSPFHDIPPNSVDLEYDRSAPGEGLGSGYLGEIQVVGPPPTAGIRAPGWVRMKSHTVITAADGTQTVDVVFECEDITGATNYNVRTTS